MKIQSKECLRCRVPVPQAALFCPECTLPLYQDCPYCHRTVPLGSRNCPHGGCRRPFRTCPRCRRIYGPLEDACATRVGGCTGTELEESTVSYSAPLGGLGRSGSARLAPPGSGAGGVEPSPLELAPMELLHQGRGRTSLARVRAGRIYLFDHGEGCLLVLSESRGADPAEPSRQILRSPVLPHLPEEAQIWDLQVNGGRVSLEVRSPGPRSRLWLMNAADPRQVCEVACDLPEVRRHVLLTREMLVFGPGSACIMPLETEGLRPSVGQTLDLLAGYLVDDSYVPTRWRDSLFLVGNRRGATGVTHGLRLDLHLRRWSLCSWGVDGRPSPTRVHQPVATEDGLLLIVETASSQELVLCGSGTSGGKLLESLPGLCEYSPRVLADHLCLREFSENRILVRRWDPSSGCRGQELAAPTGWKARDTLLLYTRQGLHLAALLERPSRIVEHRRGAVALWELAATPQRRGFQELPWSEGMQMLPGTDCLYINARGSGSLFRLFLRESQDARVAVATGEDL